MSASLDGLACSFMRLFCPFRNMKCHIVVLYISRVERCSLLS